MVLRVIFARIMAQIIIEIIAQKISFAPLFSSAIITEITAEILWLTYKCDELSASSLTSEPNVDPRLSDLFTRSFQRATGVCHLPQLLAWIFKVCSRHVSLLAPSDSLTFQHAWQQTRQTGAEFIWISRYRPTNSCTSVIACCMLHNPAENHADKSFRKIYHVNHHSPHSASRATKNYFIDPPNNKSNASEVVRVVADLLGISAACAIFL